MPHASTAMYRSKVCHNLRRMILSTRLRLRLRLFNKMDKVEVIALTDK